MAKKAIEIVFERKNGAATVLGRTVLWKKPESDKPEVAAELVFDDWTKAREKRSADLESGVYMAVTLVDVQENLDGVFDYLVTSPDTLLARRKGDVNTTSQKVGEMGHFRHARVLKVA